MQDYGDGMKRMEFEFKGETFKFTLNPEDYSLTFPNKMKVTQTEGGAFIDAYGEGVPEITIKGTTGYSNNTGDITDGFKQMKALRDLIRTIYSDPKLNNVATEHVKFYNFTDDEYWYVYPERFVISRSRNRPLLFMYDIKLYCVKDMEAPPSDETGLEIDVPVPDTTDSIPTPPVGSLDDTGAFIRDASNPNYELVYSRGEAMEILGVG